MGRVITDATKMKFDCVKELVMELKINGFSYPELFLYIESFGLKGEEKDILRRAVFASAGISEKNIVFS